MSQLYKIAEASGPHRASAIFIHGLGGDPHTTWRSGSGEDTFWPKWLASDVPGLTVYTLGYEAAISRWRGAAMHLPDRAKNVLEQLLVYPDLAHGPLYLIGHSLGGLVIKQLLRTAESEGKYRPEVADFLARIEKVAFLGTPHTGSGQATLANVLRVLVRPSEATACLIHNDPSLRDLNHWYQDWANSKGLPHLILSETQPTRILGKLVQPNSADPGIAGWRALPVGTTHSGVCKPVSRDHEVYLHARAFVARDVRPRPDPIIAKVGEVSDDVKKLLAAFEARGGVEKAETGGLERQAVVDLAGRLKPDEALDFDRAMVELEGAVNVALNVIAKGERGTNQGDFINAVLTRVADQTKAGRFDQAAKEVDAALIELAQHEIEHREEIHRSRLTLLQAGIDQDILRRDAVSVARRIQETVELEHPDNPTAWFEGLAKKHRESWIEGRNKGTNFSLEIAAEIARRELLIAHDERERGAALNDLALALRTLGEHDSGTTRLEEAVATYRRGLQEWTRERAPLDWAGLLNNLGNALGLLGGRVLGTTHLDEAVGAYREALKERTRERVPLDWAMTQSNLGNALATLGERRTDDQHLDEAVAAYREALKERKRELVPKDWAATQNNLGNVLRSLGMRQRNRDALIEAIEAFRESLKERTRDRLPLAWAATQNNLGIALANLGDLDDDIAAFNKSLEAFHLALQERTRERAPYGWAQTQENLAGAHFSIAKRSRRQADAVAANGAISAALEIYREGNADYDISTAECLQDAISDLLSQPPPPIG
ncbi:MAG: tetratricopeptide repeat protein [Xanthobacteraceae bacterium]